MGNGKRMKSKNLVPQCLNAVVPFVCAFVTLCLFFSFVFFLLSFSACGNEKKNDMIKEAIPFSLASVDSIQYKLEDYRGKIVLLHFWADWCPHCRQEFAKLQKVDDELKGRGLQILAVNVGQTKKHVLELKEEYRLSIPLLLDENKDLAEKYGVKGLPTSFFIDKQGMIKQKEIGWLSTEQVQAVFQKMTAENQ
jgi:peroxiredoxin